MKSLLSWEVRWMANPSPSQCTSLSDGSSLHCQYVAAAAAAAVDWGYTSCRNADRQHADHRTPAHSPMRVDRRTPTLLTRKTSRRFSPKHNAGRPPQSSQWSSARDRWSEDGKRHTEKVTRGKNMANWTVPTRRFWHYRHISFTPQLHSVCVERRGKQLKRDDWKSAGESEGTKFVFGSKIIDFIFVTKFGFF